MKLKLSALAVLLALFSMTALVGCEPANKPEEPAPNVTT